MRPVGELFRPKISFEALKEELVPSFDSVLEAWLGGPRRTNFADPNYVLDATYPTPPLKVFVERIVERLNIFTIVGGPLERGFGFGKTHALIFLWHLFTTDIYRKAELRVSGDVVRETLVLGMDYSADKPFVKLLRELEAYADPSHSIARIKDPKLVQAISQVIRRYSERELYSLTSDELANLLLEVLEEYEKLGGRPRLLLLIDELGWGLARRLRRYAERRDEEIYKDVNAVINFLSYLYDRLYSRAIAGVVIWVLAEQDRRELDILAMKHRDDEILHGKIKGVVDDLDNIADRYSRGLGGTSIAELSYSSEHALEIAKYRILKTVEGADLAKLQDEYIRWLGSLAEQLNLEDIFTRHREELRKYYPFSLGLINLMKKLMNPRDAPATEFVRMVIQVASEAAKNALSTDTEGTYTIGVKHLSIPGAVQARVMGPFEADWIQATADIEDTLSKMEGDERRVAERIAKYILAKGVTANIIGALESRDRREIEKYGSTIDEIQLELLSTSREAEAFQLIEKLGGALERLRAESARIDEKEIAGVRYYMPSLFRTIFNRLAAYIIDEKKNIENKQLIPIYIKQTGTIPSLFTNVRVTVGGRPSSVTVCLMEYRKVKDIDAFLSDPAFQEAQSKGRLLVVLIPPWDMSLFNELYEGESEYDDTVKSVARRLQYALNAGKIRRHLHIVVLIPDLSSTKMKRMLDKLVIYEGTKKFLDYLSRKEEVISERLREYEETFIKRKDLLEILESEARRRALRELRSKLEKEIIEARNYAQRDLVRLSRDLVISVLELYHSVVYYSLDQGLFTTKSIVSEEVARLPSDEYIAISDLSNYASIVNKFLLDVIRGLAYESDAIKIARAVLETYKNEFEKGVIREFDRLDEVLENIILGTYGVKPLSLEVAEDALRYLRGQVIELEDRIVKIDVDTHSRVIKFIVEIKERPKEEIAPTPSEILEESLGELETRPPVEALESVLLELPPGYDVTDVHMRLTSLLQQYEVSLIDFSFEADDVSMRVTLRTPTLEALSRYRVILNLISRLSRDRGKAVSVEARLVKPVPLRELKEILGNYLKPGRSTFDRFLPT
ncbi:MAG: hypothetical protein DRJ59_04920 [Thermoprotei archaeon]|nr:MAG: hypothetical protein DRJ59_04920 [Thermoprotei archaeon]